MNILIIDDNPDDLEFYSDLLLQSTQGFKVFTAQGGEEALNLFTRHRIDCAFIDYNLPEMNGLKILEKLNALDADRTLPLVILTGEPDQTVKAEAARKGALNYLIKDTTNTVEQLENIISKALAWAKILNEEKVLEP